MNKDRWQLLMKDDSEPLSRPELHVGWHFCPEWDGLLVGPGMPEAKVCKCFNPQLRPLWAQIRKPTPPE